MPAPKSPLTASEFATALARKLKIPDAQSRAILQAVAEIAYANVRRGSYIPGIGLLQVTHHPKRRMRIHFGEQAGKMVTGPANRKYKLRISDLAREHLTTKKAKTPPPDVFSIDAWPPDPEYVE